MSAEHHRIAADILIAKIENGGPQWINKSAADLAEDFQKIFNQVTFADSQAERPEKSGS